MLVLLHVDAAECKLFAGAALYGKGRRGHWLPDRDELAIIPVLKSAMPTPQPMPTTPHSGDVPATVSWQDVLTSLEDAVMVVDCSRGVTFLNQAAETLTGLSARKMLAHDSGDLFHANDWLVAMIDKSLGPDESTSRAENDFVPRRGKHVPSLPDITGDRGRLIQVFLNLVENALQAKPTCMTVTPHIETDFSLRTDRSDPTRFVTVDIRDDGTGIDDEDLPDIFSPFFTRKRHGTGLGLAICDRTVKEHGGRLGVESHLGEGSVFEVSLPARQG